MMGSCLLVVVLSIFFTFNPAIAFVTWYDASTTPVISDTNEISLQIRNTTIPEELDLLRLLNVSGSTPGVSKVLGPSGDFPAYKFRLGYNNVLVPNSRTIAAALTAPMGFTLLFVYRQHRKSLGTLLSVHSPGRVTPWFQVTSNLRTGQLGLHYRVNSDSKLHQNSWPLQQLSEPSVRVKSIPNADINKKGNGWTHLALVFNASKNTFTLHLDCQPPKEQFAIGNTGSGTVDFHIPSDALVYFRQEPGFKKKFLGSMQVAKIKSRPITRQEIGWSCTSPPGLPEHTTTSQQ